MRILGPDRSVRADVSHLRDEDAVLPRACHHHEVMNYSLVCIQLLIAFCFVFCFHLK